MFNTIRPYRFVQRNRNFTGGRESWSFEDIYKFFIHSPDSQRKYLVEVHAYTDHLYTVDFYAKVLDVNRYLLHTNQYAAGKLGATVLDVIARIIGHDSRPCFGFIAAAMPDETSDESTKRFNLYTRMLELKVDARRRYITINPEDSSLFMLLKALAANQSLKQDIIERYESVFRETF